MGVVVAYGAMALFSVGGTLLSLFGLLLLLRFAFRFITAPAGGRAAPSRPAAAFAQPAAAVSMPPAVERTVAMSQADPPPPSEHAPAIGEPDREPPPSAERLFNLSRDSKPADTFAVIANWRAATPAQGLRAAWYGAILLVILNGLQLLPLAFPGPQFEVGSPSSFSGSDKLIELVVAIIISGIELGFAAILQRWRARWAGVLLLSLAIFSLIEAGTPPYHYIVGTGIVAAAIALASKLVFSGLEAASAYRRGVALNTQDNRAWARTPWALGLIALFLAAAATYITSYEARTLTATPGQSVQASSTQQGDAQAPAPTSTAGSPPSLARGPEASPVTQPPPTGSVGTTPAEWSAFLSTSDPEWARYPALPLSGAPRAPQIDAAHADDRSRIEEAASDGVNFGGVAHLLQFGCGAECSVAMIVDLSTGRVDDFPNGGEDYSQLTLAFSPKSRLIRSTWKSTEGDVGYCMGQAFVWEYGRVRAIGPQLRSPEPADDGCPGGQA